MIARGRPLLVLYSGGRDSTCLLDLAVRVAGAPDVHALHVNYRLRKGADEDEAHCRAGCAALGVELTVVRPGPPVANVQAWARRERYWAARAAAADLGPGAAIAAGHTATDQLETILYRLASSPSRRALLGMRERSGADPELLRPLLAFTRTQTAAHCRARGLAWREDETNATLDYARGRVRHELVPALERVHPAAAANVLALADVLGAEAAVLEELVDGVLGGGETREIAVATLRAQPPALRRLIVQRLADRAAGEPAAGVARRAEEVAALPERGSATLHLPHGVRAQAARGVIRFSATPPRPARPRGAGPGPGPDSGAA